MVTKIISHEAGDIIEWKWASDNELIPSPFFCSVYHVDGILIDSGAPAGVNDFRNFVKEIKEKSPLKLCVITHTHEDHCGGAHILQREFKIPLFAHENAIKILREEHTYPQYRQAAWGEKRLPVEAEIIPASITSQSGNYVFEVFPMPGHSPDQIALIEKTKQWLFTADAIQPKYKMLFGGESDIQEDMQEIYNSIKKLDEYTEGMGDLKIFLSGHDEYKGKAFLTEKLNEINSLHRKVHQLFQEESEKLQDNEKILKKILKRTFGRETAIGTLTRGDLSIMNLIKSLLKWPLS